MTAPRDLYLRCPVQLSARTPVLTAIFLGFTYVLEEDAGMIPKLCHDLILSYPYKFFSVTKRPEAVGPTQPPIQLVPVFFRGKNGRGVMSTTHLYVVPRLK
jgi:hypothetical protein